MPSAQPSKKPETGRTDGLSLVESTILPLRCHVEKVTFTPSLAVGWTFPVPGERTLLASPSFIVWASGVGPAKFSGGFGPGVISNSSTSNTSIPAGAPGLPLYASSCGIQRRRFSPTTMSCMPSVQPGMTCDSERVIGAAFFPFWSGATELSNIFPSVVQPE